MTTTCPQGGPVPHAAAEEPHDLDDLQDARRAAGIAAYDVLDHPPGADLQALVELTAQICQVSTAAITLITDSQQHELATVGFEPAICAREDSMCNAVLRETRPVVVPDARLDRRFARSPFVTGELDSVRFYAASTLRTPDGVAIGTLCVFDRQPRTLSSDQHDALETLAERVVDLLELRLRTRQLERSLAELTVARDELDRSNEQLAVFAGQVSHDLRTPLAGVLGYLQELSEAPAVSADEQASWMASRALSSGQRMQEQIEDLLDYAQVGGSLRLAEVDLGAVAGEVAHDLRAQLEASGARLVVEELPVVLGDQAQLRALLQNLVANAAKFSRPGVAPRIRISCRRVGDRWWVEVADNGVGVPPDQRAAAFDLLARVGDGTAEGCGIGLATCRRIVEAHGGTIGIDAAAEGGALVWFELPRS